MPSIEWWRNHVVKLICKPSKFLKGKRVVTKLQIKEKRPMGISCDSSHWFNPEGHSVTLSDKTEERRPSKSIFDSEKKDAVITVDTLEKLYKEHKADISYRIGQWLLSVVFVQMINRGEFLEVTVKKPEFKGCSDKLLISILLDKGFEGVLITNEDYVVLTLPEGKFQ